METTNKYSVNEELKSEIKKRLKTFSELKNKYKLDKIYRSGEEEFFSEKAKFAKLEGVPKSRPATILSNSYTESSEYILEPIWYSTNYKDSRIYCGNNPTCNTYAYIPYDKSLVAVPSNDNSNWLFPQSKINKNLLFLDLTGVIKSRANVEGDDNGDWYQLDQSFIKLIYDTILHNWKEYFDPYGDSDDIDCHIMGIDKKCESVFSKKEIKDAYGYYDGKRDSEQDIDKFFTIELFNIIKDSNIENELNCRFMGYFHANIEKSDNGFFPAEFAIPYSCAISKTFINFLGVVNDDCDSDDNGVCKKRKRKTGGMLKINKKSKKLKKTKSSKKSKTLKKLKSLKKLNRK
jgi:hypothetical protein